MIKHVAFTVEPWTVREQHLHLDVLAQTESIFGLSNGHIGMRGNLDEGEPHGIPGTYLNSVCELRPLPYAESGYGYPESGQTVINVTNGKLIRLLVEDEPFDVRYGRLHRHERVLDLRAGTLTREVDWESPAHCRVRIHATRLVSLTHRAVAAIRYRVTAGGQQTNGTERTAREEAGRPVRVVLQSELVANEPLPDLGRDPRTAALLESPLALEENLARPERSIMVHTTRRSGLRIGAGMTHDVEGPEGLSAESDGSGDVSRYTIAARLDPGESLEIVKYIAYGWSAQRSRAAMRDQVVAALADARHTGWDGLVEEQRAFLDTFWEGADVEVDGDAEVQQAVRFALFHVLQSAARAERRPIPAKGLTGPGYDGHTFWDSEIFVLPVLTYTHPEPAADVLRWRQDTLDKAFARARDLGLEGAAFPWRTIGGEECSGYWPASTAALHVNAAVAHAVVQYVDATRDDRFRRETALPLLVATARLWRSAGQHDIDGRFRIDGVTGPDEYSALADNNVYTNLMAALNLRAAADLAAQLRREADGLGVTPEEVASWRDAADAVVIPYDTRLGIHQQSEGFTNHERWDFSKTSADQYPLLLHFPYFQLYRKQVVKQADLVLAMQLCPDAFAPDQVERNFAYYEELTVRDSSLSACTQSAVAARAGHLDLAHDYLGEAALMDLDDYEHNTRDGLHMASLAGTWNALVQGLGGMRANEGILEFCPRLPGGIARLAFRLRYRGSLLRLTVAAGEARYECIEGPPLRVRHEGEEFALDRTPVVRPVSPVPSLPEPRQPEGRRPQVRHAGAHTH